VSFRPSRPKVTASFMVLDSSKGFMAGLTETFLAGIADRIGLSNGSALGGRSRSGDRAVLSSQANQSPPAGSRYGFVKTGERGDPGEGAESLLKSN
jgi:hypothetical protein